MKVVNERQTVAREQRSISMRSGMRWSEEGVSHAGTSVVQYRWWSEVWATGNGVFCSHGPMLSGMEIDIPNGQQRLVAIEQKPEPERDAQLGHALEVPDRAVDDRIGEAQGQWRSGERGNEVEAGCRNARRCAQ